MPEPLAIFHKGIQWNRCARLTLRRSFISFKRESSTGVGYVGRHAGRTQKHARWHLVRPEIHRFPKHTRSDALRLEMNRGGQSIRTGTNNCDLAVQQFTHATHECSDLLVDNWSIGDCWSVKTAFPFFSLA